MSYTAAKIRKAFNVNVEDEALKIRSCILTMLPYFCKKFSKWKCKEKTRAYTGYCFLSLQHS